MGSVIAIIGNEGFSLLNFRGPLIEDLVARGHRVLALAPDMDDYTRSAIEALGGEPHPIALKRAGLNPLADANAFLSILRELRRLKPDIALAYAAKPVIYGTLAAWAAGVPQRFAMVEGLGYVFIDRPGEGAGRRLLRRAVKGLYRLALRRADRAIFLNEDDIADFASMGLVEPEKAIKLGGIGVDLEEWRPVPPVFEPVTFTFVGRLLRDKGVNEFIAAARLTRRTNSETRFLLIGGLDPNPESVSLKEVRSWVAEGLVEWPGHVPAQPWLEQTSVFVLPSYREGVPRSTQEAMAMARPVITTDVPGCRETVIDGQNGFLVPVRDAESLAAAMRRFIGVPESIASMGVKSRELAEERYDVRKVNATLIGIMGL